MNTVRWAAIATAALLGVAACGGGGPTATKRPSPATLTKELNTAVAHASSVHVSGLAPVNGKDIALNLSMTRAGGVSGQVSIAGDAFTVLATRGSTYIKVTTGFLNYAHLPASTCSLVCGKYLKVSPAESGVLLAGLNMTRLMGDLTKGAPHFRNGGTATVDGQRAWVLRSSTGTTAYVAATGPAYPLRAVAPPGKRGKLDLTQWNRATIPPPPPASEVVDLSQLHA